MWEQNRIGHVAVSIAAFALCMAVVGCIAFPTRMTTRRYGSGGGGLHNSDVDLTFIKIGFTPRGEIATRLRAIDVNSPGQIFWGRWIESSWGVVAGSLPPLSTTADPAAGSARHWHYRNVLIKFDPQGIAAEMQRIDNDEALWRQLLVYMRSSLSAPMSVIRGAARPWDRRASAGQARLPAATLDASQSCCTCGGQARLVAVTSLHRVCMGLSARIQTCIGRPLRRKERCEQN